MSAYLTPFTAVLVALATIGVYNLQAWLEHWDHNRHFND
jgi:hypothetical protein